MFGKTDQCGKPVNPMRRYRRPLQGLGAAAFSLGLTAVAGGQELARETLVERDQGVRATTARRVTSRDAAMDLLIAQGRARSSTVARLLHRLESSDVAVSVELEKGAGHDPGGQLRFTGMRDGVRHLQIVIKPGTTSWATMLSRHIALITVLGHELQHAAEVADAGEVIDARTFAAFYRRMGIRLGRADVDTVAARRVSERVYAELTGGEHACTQPEKLCMQLTPAWCPAP